MTILKTITLIALVLTLSAMLGSTTPGVRIAAMPLAVFVAALLVRAGARLAPTLVAAARA